MNMFHLSVVSVRRFVQWRVNRLVSVQDQTTERRGLGPRSENRSYQTGLSSREQREHTESICVTSWARPRILILWSNNQLVQWRHLKFDHPGAEGSPPDPWPLSLKVWTGTNRKWTAPEFHHVKTYWLFLSRIFLSSCDIINVVLKFSSEWDETLHHVQIPQEIL